MIATGHLPINNYWVRRSFVPVPTWLFFTTPTEKKDNRRCISLAIKGQHRRCNQWCANLAKKELVLHSLGYRKYRICKANIMIIVFCVHTTLECGVPQIQLCVGKWNCSAHTKYIWLKRSKACILQVMVGCLTNHVYGYWGPCCFA